MKTMIILILAVFSVVCVGWAEESQRIAFGTPKDIACARLKLKDDGLRRFMEDAWAQGVSAPGIHSKYWVDRLADPDAVVLETARREFGRELAWQVDLLAADVFRNPDRNRECARLDWMLNFVEWVGAAGCFENYRIAMRTEEAATMALLRIVMDLSVPDKEVETLISRFTTLRRSAPVRARILYEESNGVIDVRSLARRADETEDGFSAEWLGFRAMALRHFGDRRYEYSKAKDVLGREDDRYAFFMDDSPGAPYRDSTHWDSKVHKKVCVYRSQASFLTPIVNAFRFRKLVGRFPDVKVPAGEPEYDAYQGWYDREYDWVFRQHRICPSTVAAYYLMYKHNSYTDSQTWELLNKDERAEIVRTNMMKGE